MTICIAAAVFSGDGMEIIMCSDKRLTVSDFVSADVGYKLHAIGPRMACMAADDTSLATELISLYRQHLSSKTIADSDLLSELRFPPVTLRRRLVEEYLETNWSMSRAEYHAGAAKGMIESDQAQIARELRAITLQVHLLIGTFDSNCKARIFAVDDKGAVRENDSFAAIGSGAWHAVSSLYHRQYSIGVDYDQAVFYVFEAKKRSEVDSHVGPDTVIAVLSSERDEWEYVTGAGINFLERRYKTMQSSDGFDISNLALVRIAPYLPRNM